MNALYTRSRTLQNKYCTIKTPTIFPMVKQLTPNQFLCSHQKENRIGCSVSKAILQADYKTTLSSCKAG